MAFTRKLIPEEKKKWGGEKYTGQQREWKKKWITNPTRVQKRWHKTFKEKGRAPPAGCYYTFN